MKLANANPNIRTNVSNKVDFGISKDAAKLFAMLSTALYSDKEAAVLYEIGANCEDAHRLNGCTKPWDLTIPTKIDPYIRFRDYGPGLSEQQVYTLLTTYGESTKSDTNEFIGAYGLGSKSPASVTSTWNVVSHYEGMMTEYLVFVDASGIPALTRIRAVPTDSTGLEVVIPVAEHRFWNWTEKIGKVFQYYKTRPNVINFNPRYDKSKPLQTGEGWVLNGSTGYGNGISFITNQRAYGVNKETIRTEFKNKDFLNLFNLSLEIYFETGELETSLSREELQYTKHTLHSIESKMTAVFDDIKSKVTALLSDAVDSLNYREKVFVVSKDFFGEPNPHQIFKYIAGNKYGVNDQNDLHSFDVEVKDFDGLNGKVFNGKSLSALRRSFTCWKTYAILGEKGIGKDKSGTLKFKIRYLDKLKIVINNVRGAASRVRGSCTAYTLLVDKNIFPAELQRFVVEASDLPKIVKTRVPRGERKKIESEFWAPGRNSWTRIPETSINKSNKIVAVLFDDARSLGSLSTIQANLMRHFMGRIGFTVIGIKNGKYVPKWCTPIEEYAIEEVEQLNTQENANLAWQAGARQNLESYSYEPVVRAFRDSKFRTKHQSVWNKLKDEVNALKASVSTPPPNYYWDMVTVAGVLQVDVVPPNKTFITLDSIKNELYNTYKMLRIVNSADQELITEYINLVGV